jgi:hypothetical protein
VKVNFWKLFKETIRKVLYMVAVHIEGLGHALICFFDEKGFQINSWWGVIGLKHELPIF